MDVRLYVDQLIGVRLTHEDELAAVREAARVRLFALGRVTILAAGSLAMETSDDEERNAVTDLLVSVSRTTLQGILAVSSKIAGRRVSPLTQSGQDRMEHVNYTTLEPHEAAIAQSFLDEYGILAAAKAREHTPLANASREVVEAVYLGGLAREMSMHLRDATSAHVAAQ